MKNWKASITKVGEPEPACAGYFETESEANEWLEEQKLKEGRRPERVIDEPVLDQDGNEQVNEEGSLVTEEVTFPAEATYEIVDSSEESNRIERLKAFKSDISKNKEDMNFGSMLIAFVGMKNEQKSLTHEQKNAMMQDSSLSTILSMLQAGRIGFSKQLVTAYSPDGVYITVEDKEEILQIMDDYLADA